MSASSSRSSASHKSRTSSPSHQSVPPRTPHSGHTFYDAFTDRPPRPPGSTTASPGAPLHHAGGQFLRYAAQSCRQHRRTDHARWSFVLQDIPDRLRQRLYDVHTGYAARVACVASLTLSLSYALYHVVVVQGQAHTPLAQRWMCVSPKVPIVFVERRGEDVEGAAAAVACTFIALRCPTRPTMPATMR